MITKLLRAKINPAHTFQDSRSLPGKKSETKMRATKYSNLFSFILTNLTSLRASENFTTWEDLLKNPLIKLVLPKIIELGIA